MFQIVKGRRLVLRYATELSKKDEEIAIEAIQQNCTALDSASDLDRNDKLLLIKAVKIKVFVSIYGTKSIRNGTEFNRGSVKTNDHALKLAFYRIKDVKGLAMEGVEQNAYASECNSMLLNYETEMEIGGCLACYCKEFFRKTSHLSLSTKP